MMNRIDDGSIYGVVTVDKGRAEVSHRSRFRGILVCRLDDNPRDFEAFELITTRFI